MDAQKGWQGGTSAWRKGREGMTNRRIVSPTASAAQDRLRVSASEDYEVEYLAKKHGVTRAEVLAAIKGAGPLRSDVERYLGRPSHAAKPARVGGELLDPGRDGVRRPGTLRGRIRMAPDFDVLPDEILSSIENGPI